MKRALPFLLALALLRPPPARAATPVAADARRREAAERFDRGMALLDEGDHAGALAELTRAYELVPHPQVLFDIGLVYVAMSRPVEATRTFDEVLAAPGRLPKDSVELARRKRDEQARRVGRLAITTNVPATVLANGIAVGKTPLPEPLPIAAGALVVTVASPGYLPLRKEITVAGETTATLALELVASELRLAHLEVRTPLPDVDVFVDGERVARTPLASTLTLPPGRRVLQMRRRGYRPWQKEVALGDGARGAIDFDLDEAEGEPGRGRLVLAVSENDPDIAIDGRARGAYRGPLALPPGLHQLRVARAGFVATERLVSVPEGGDATVRVTLVPTPQTRAEHKQRAQTQRRWGWMTGIGGAAAAVAGAALFTLNRGGLADARDQRDVLVGMQANCRATGMEESCAAELHAADADVNTHKLRQNVGLGALAVGLAAAGVGTALLLTADDPERYDRPPRDFDTPPALSGWLAPGAGGLALAGRF